MGVTERAQRSREPMGDADGLEEEHEGRSARGSGLPRSEPPGRVRSGKGKFAL